MSAVGPRGGCALPELCEQRLPLPQQGAGVIFRPLSELGRGSGGRPGQAGGGRPVCEGCSQSLEAPCQRSSDWVSKSVFCRACHRDNNTS